MNILNRTVAEKTKRPAPVQSRIALGLFCTERKLTMRHFVNLNDLSNAEIQELIGLALAYKSGDVVPKPQNRLVANLFFENSTRTQSSFQVAETRLGWQQIILNPATSSTQKGETLLDTVKTLGAIGIETVVIRHQENNWYSELINDKSGRVPQIVNAGDGSGQHPSQSLLDLVTIMAEFGHFEGLKVRIVGDLAHSRVARSNAEILTRLRATVSFSGPTGWYPEDFQRYGELVDLDENLDDQDILMFLRVQHERINADDKQAFDVEKYHAAYGLNQSRYDRMKANAIIMHPAPVNRGVEIADELVEAEKSRIFEQMTNGVFARMAILHSLQEAPNDNIID
jgi:aspartate carbamoyltransferase catalytic subunit